MSAQKPSTAPVITRTYLDLPVPGSCLGTLEYFHRERAVPTAYPKSRLRLSPIRREVKKAKG